MLGYLNEIGYSELRRDKLLDDESVPARTLGSAATVASAAADPDENVHFGSLARGFQRREHGVAVLDVMEILLQRPLVAADLSSA